MGFLDDVIKKGRALTQRLIQPDPPDIKTTDAVIHDRFDQWDWEYLRNEVPSIDKNIKEIAMKHDYVEDFFEDVYNALHQGDPIVRDKKDINERYQPNVDMSKHLLDMAEVKSLRLSTMHDRYATAMAMLSMQSALKSMYEQHADERQAAKEAAEQREKLQDLLNELAGMMENADGLEGEAADNTAEEIDAILAEIMEQAGITEEALKAMLEAAEAGQGRGDMAVRAAARQATQAAENEQQLTRAFGMEDGQLQQMSYEERKKLSELLKNNRLAEFAKLIGQFRNIESGEARRKIIHAPDEVMGVELGDNLTRLTAGEMLNIAEPELEDDFWRRWADKELVQYQLRGREKIGKGPIIVVCDESGSMGQIMSDGTTSATAEAWSKAMALALCERAKREGRDFHYIGFSSRRQIFHMEFPGGKAPIEKVVQFTEHFFGGGTHYEEALTKAMEIVQEYHDNKKPKPDIVFITDDCYHAVSDDFLQRWEEVKATVQMRCFGILIGENDNESGALNSVSDNVRTINSMKVDPNETRDMFQMI